uniref:uncharacterized protein LOC122604542 n=1 Tax=Erigeron canadensis TaxID=72917 RepID=UPI001CB9CC66|nr:uncharacterized protein LOC122604542 [Erigeron canadensis]
MNSTFTLCIYEVVRPFFRHKKVIAAACAFETSKAIVDDIAGDYYSILVDECRDASVIKRTNGNCYPICQQEIKGHITERFLGFVHVPYTTLMSMKEAIESILGRHKLSMSQIRGQAYDGASNMRVLEIILEDVVSSDHKGKAKRLLTWLLSFDFAFTSILMKSVLKVTNELCLRLQRKDVDIVNAIKLVQIAKERLETMRNDGWEQLDKEVSIFCHNSQVQH